MRALRFSFAILGVLLAVSRLNATTIVAVWTDQRVTIVADSKITLTNREGLHVGSDTGCKVHVVRDVIVATAGLLRNETVDVIAAIEQARELKEQGTGKPLPEMGTIVAAQRAVQQALNARKADFDPSLAVSLIIATREAGQPTLTRVEWIPMKPDQLAKDGDKPWNRSFAFGTRQFKYPENRADAENPDRGVEIIGVRNAISKYKSETTTEEWNDSDAARFGKKLVRLEASDPADSTVVGGPLTVVTLDKDGVRWSERGACTTSMAR
jgi:hypothetical protein